MTTIAYRDGFIAADTQLTYGAIRNGFREKLAVTKNYIVALAGPSWLRKALESWAQEGCPDDAIPCVLTENESEFEALFIDPNGEAFLYDNGYLVPVAADYTAIGSGGQIALGAMAHPESPASARQAVMAASVHDKNTGGNIQSLHYSILRS